MQYALAYHTGGSRYNSTYFISCFHDTDVADYTFKILYLIADLLPIPIPCVNYMLQYKQLYNHNALTIN